MSGRDAHRAATFVLSAVMVVLGVALIAQALSGGGGPLSPRTLLGLLFVAAGTLRMYLEIRRNRER